MSADLFEKLLLYQLIVEPPLHADQFVVIDAREKTDRDLEPAGASSSAAIVATGLGRAQCLLEKLIRIQRDFVGPHRSDHHLAVALDDDPVDDRGVNVLFGHQEVRGLRYCVAVFASKKSDTRDRVALANLAILKRLTDDIHHLFRSFYRQDVFEQGAVGHAAQESGGLEFFHAAANQSGGLASYSVHQRRSKLHVLRIALGQIQQAVRDVLGIDRCE